MRSELLQESFIEILQNQIHDGNPRCTKEKYEELLRNGYDAAYAMDILCHHLELHVKDMLLEQKEFDEETWEKELSTIANININEAEEVTAYQMKKICGKIKKEFGSIPAGKEDPYMFELAYLETELLEVANKMDFHSRQIRVLVELWMFIMYGSLRDITYDFRNVAGVDLIESANYLNSYSNPLYSEDVKEKAQESHPDIDFSLTENVEVLYETNFKVLVKIHESIDFWEKELGSDGYLTYLKRICGGYYDDIEV